MNRPPDAASSPWRLYATQSASDERDLIWFAGITKRERDKLRAVDQHSAPCYEKGNESD